MPLNLQLTVYGAREVRITAFFLWSADKAFWSDVGNDLLRQKLQQEYRFGVAKNVIFFLGDGMSITTLTSARIYKGQMENKTGEDETLSFEKFPFTGLSKVSAAVTPEKLQNSDDLSRGHSRVFRRCAICLTDSRYDL